MLEINHFYLCCRNAVTDKKMTFNFSKKNTAIRIECFRFSSAIADSGGRGRSFSGDYPWPALVSWELIVLDLLPLVTAADKHTEDGGREQTNLITGQPDNVFSTRSRSGRDGWRRVNPVFLRMSGEREREKMASASLRETRNKQFGQSFSWRACCGSEWEKCEGTRCSFPPPTRFAL